MTQQISKKLYWTPRILSILLILFLFLFSFDVFGEGLTVWQMAGAFLMHNIPVIILSILLTLSWNREWIGGITFIFAGLLYSALTFTSSIPWYLALSWSMIISGPSILIGVLFYINWFKRKA